MAIEIIDITPAQSALEYLKQPSTLVALTAISISIISLCLSMRFNRKTLLLTKKHNKLSIKPILNLETLSIDKHYVIQLSNQGVGPGIIKSISYKHNGSEFKSMPALVGNIVNSPEKKICASKLMTSKDECMTIDSGYTVGANKTCPLFKSYGVMTTDINEYHTLFKVTEIIVQYEDIYESQYALKDFVCHTQ